ncbi:HNH endonuclease [Pantoea sp. Tr-811]|uniref:HNH endonuclease n=1 Tax=Pantoea sp. Tr-811 TaxID=2608361 RepID=UPI001420AD90|nr:HNH endonuclease [Pantoea sp. Tr-811]NIF29462.1 HNH endonuclease [Pantoea sp. Tr-811]
MHIDHLIPEYLLSNHSERAEVFASLGMKDFDIRSSLNLVPSCQECNSSKGGMHIAPNQMILYLNQVSRKQKKLNEILGKAKTAKSVDKIIRDIERAVSSGAFGMDQLVGGLAVRLNDCGYVIEKVEMPRLAAANVIETVKPIFFVGHAESDLMALGVNAHKVCFRLDSLRYGNMEGVRNVSQLDASEVRVGEVNVIFKVCSEKIYVLSIKRKSLVGKVDGRRL